MINDKREKIEVLKKKVQAYFENQLAVHIVLDDGEWLNGEITKISDEFFMIEENKKGTMPVFFLELHDINKKEEKRE